MLFCNFYKIYLTIFDFKMLFCTSCKILLCKRRKILFYKISKKLTTLDCRAADDVNYSRAKIMLTIPGLKCSLLPLALS